jgi:hypothetical protein
MVHSLLAQQKLKVKFFIFFFAVISVVPGQLPPEKVDMTWFWRIVEGFVFFAVISAVFHFSDFCGFDFNRSKAEPNRS